MVLLFFCSSCGSCMRLVYAKALCLMIAILGCLCRLIDVGLDYFTIVFISLIPLSQTAAKKKKEVDPEADKKRVAAAAGAKAAGAKCSVCMATFQSTVKPSVLKASIFPF